MNKFNSSGNHLTEKTLLKHFLLITRTTLILLFTCIFCSMAEIEQNKTITGRIIDEMGSPIIGANII